MYDYDKSISKLANRVRLMHESNWSPTPEAKALEELAMQLEQTAALMDRDCYWYLEEEFNKPTLGYVRFDGTREPQIDRSGQFANVRYRMIELADFARQQKNELPNPRKRSAPPFAAVALLHIMYQCGKPRPSLYDNSDAVLALGVVLEKAGICLSKERLRGLLTDALKSFDPCYMNEGIEDVLVCGQ